jgi:cysteine synthase
MSKERYERIRQYGGALDLTPGSESDVILVLERTEFYKTNPKYKVLAQFELLPNYRFHRYVTGRSAIEAAQAYGNGRVAAFVSAPGSAGTLAAGDEIKAQFPDAAVCAVEPKECSTLFDNGRGTHRIEGIGDKMVTLIHNVLTTDYVIRLHDDDCVRGLELVEHHLGFTALTGLFGVSGICNILGAIRLTRHLGLGPDDNVVTIATDGFDRYPSVLADLARRSQPNVSTWFESVFRGGDAADILDVRPREQKQRLFDAKQEVWTKFGYSTQYLAHMQAQSFWDGQFETIDRIDRDLVTARRF